MGDLKLRGTQAFYTALLAHRDRVRSEWVPSYDDLYRAFDFDFYTDEATRIQHLWDTDRYDLDEAFDRWGADAGPYLRALWDNPDTINREVRERALSLLMSPKSKRNNPLSAFLILLSDYGTVPASWVLRNRDALRDVWIHKRVRNPDAKRGRGVYKVREEVLYTLVAVDYADVDAELDVDDLDLKCSLVSEYGLDDARRIDIPDGLTRGYSLHRDYLTLTAVGIDPEDARMVMRHRYTRDADGLPDVESFDAVKVADAWTGCVDAGIPRPLIPALAMSSDLLPVVLEVLDTFREMNSEGGFPFALAANGLGVPDDLMTDDEWNAWCAGP